MKIAYLSTFYPFRGGIAQFNANLLNEFKKQHEAKAFTFTRQYPNILFPGKTQFVTSDDKPEIIESDRVLDSMNPFSYYSAAKKIHLFNPSLLLMKYWMSFFAPSLGKTARLLKKKGVKSISILDNVISHEKKMGEITLTKYFLNSNSGFVVMTESVKNDLLRLKPDAKYILAPHPLYDHFGNKIDKSTARTKLNIPADKKVLLFFGFIRDYKGLDILIEAMKHLDESYLLVIAGEVYGSFSKYDELIKKLGVENKIVKHVRYISDNEVPLFFSAADVCVLPYKNATQSGIVGISFHFDLPVIATNVGGLGEMIEDGKSGLIVNEISSEAIASAIKKFFTDKSSEYLSTIENYKQKHSWENLAHKIAEFSKDVSL